LGDAYLLLKELLKFICDRKESKESSGMDKDNSFTENRPVLRDFTHHAIKCLAGIDGIQYHPFEPGKIVNRL